MTRLSQVESQKDCPSSVEQDVTDWIADLHQADQTFYDLMSLELWSIAQTMDEIQPGFWADYMHNRQEIFHQHLQEQQQRHSQISQRSKRESVASRKPATLSASEAPRGMHSTPKSLSQMVAAFSSDVDHEPIEATSSGQSVSSPAIHAVTAVPQTSKTLPSNLTPKTTAQSVSLVNLPHLIHPPMAKRLPMPEVEATNSGLSLAIACWLTTHFEVLSTELGTRNRVLRQLDSITLEPGQSIICHLGFQLSNLTSPVRVQLVKRWQARGLTATWITGKPEAIIRLSNYGQQPCFLQAGQPLCHLLVNCPSNYSTPQPAALSPVVPMASVVAAG